MIRGWEFDRESAKARKGEKVTGNRRDSPSPWRRTGRSISRDFNRRGYGLATICSRYRPSMAAITH